MMEMRVLRHEAALVLRRSALCAVCMVLASAALPGASADETGLRLTADSDVTLAAQPGFSPIRLALEDLARDLEWVLGRRPRIADGDAGSIVVRIDPAIRDPERWRLAVRNGRAEIAGSDPLGAVFGIYEFSRRFLGVDPYWFWKSVRPPRRDELTVPAGAIESKPFTFRYRGWFINDEDLLTEWQEGGGARRIDYPFYHQVVHPDVADRILESLLRAGGNLVIPASFVDVFNPPEAALVERAASRGLYVSQHHVEPLGVSHFGFENFWRSKGQKAAFAYASDPDRVRQTWRAYARRWVELAGDRVVWQLGLRGRGDQPAWGADKGITEATAGEFISRALADQWEIIRAIDQRPAPPATITLWAEGSRLMSSAALRVPDGVTIVFADEGSTQTMQADFRDVPRRPDRTYGVYYHVAYWMNGPHLVQCGPPARIRRTLDAVVARGDTHYAVFNVSNVREHLLGIETAMSIARSHSDYSEEDLWRWWAPPAVADLYREFHGSFVDLGGGRLLQDGTAYGMARDLLLKLASGRKVVPQWPLLQEVLASGGQGDALSAAISRLEGVIAKFPTVQVSEHEKEFFTANLLVQAQILRGLYAYLRSLALACGDPNRLAEAEEALERILEARRRAETGQWENWYRGDKKENLPALLEKTRAVRRQLAPGAGR